MNKRYQVFVSSTYTDLKDERDKVYKTLMWMGCIPVGMECFAAESVEQWEIIKRVIDDSDFYVLIVAGRYGTVASDGRSFTEKEFDYALSQKKPVLVFCHESPQKLPLEKADLEPVARSGLHAFRAKALTNRMAAFWTNADELAMRVMLAVYQAIEKIPATGWVRDTQSARKQPIEAQVHPTRDAQNASSHKSSSEACSPKQLSNKVCRLRGTNGLGECWSIDLTWDSVFAVIASYIVVERTASSVSTLVALRASKDEGVQNLQNHPNIKSAAVFAATAGLLIPGMGGVIGLSLGALGLAAIKPRLDPIVFLAIKDFCTENGLIKIELKKEDEIETAYWSLSDKGDLLAAQIKVEKAAGHL